MKTTRKPDKDLLIVFTRYPVPGKTKTRLVPLLGPAGAADLQRSLAERTIATAREIASRRPVWLEVCFEGGDENRMRRWLGPGLLLTPQVPGDLGTRMRAAFLDAFRAGYRRVLLFGTDIPGISSRHLEGAIDALGDHDLVLGPSRDGGYWLMGLNRPLDLFRGVPWGTPAVLRETLASAGEKGLRVRQIEPLSDIDTIDDLSAWMPEAARAGPFVSVIIPALNEEGNIATAAQSALNRDSEVIVIDGGSEDRTVLRARDAGARVISGPRGRGVQQNRGAAAAGGTVLLFLHADTRLPEDYVLHVFATLMDPRTVAGAFRFKTDGSGPAVRAVEIFANLRAKIFRLPYGDQALFMKAGTFQRVDGFPEVPIGEDLFLVRRLGKMGPVRIAPAGVVTSCRRWKALGPFRTTLINQIMLAGFFLRIPLPTLASLYRRHPGRP